MRKRPLAYVACVFLTGLVYQRFQEKLLLLVVVLFFLLEAWYGLKERNFRRTAGRSAILLSAVLLGSLHMQREMNFREVYMSKIVDGCEVIVWGELVKTETTDYGNRGFLSDCYIRLQAETIPCNDIVVYMSDAHLYVGQIYKLTGKVNMFSEARNEGNFDSLRYYQSLKVDFAIEEETSVLLGKSSNGWKTFLYSLRQKIGNVYGNCMEEKVAGFYQAMVLGDKTDLQEELKGLFLIGGISHILAISGLHVSIIGRGLYRFLRHLGLDFGIAGICGGVLLVFYCVMVGSSASTVRAVGMMLLFFLAQWLGRSYDMLNSLGGMVLILLWENPFLIENIGFWFSVTALLGVGYVGIELAKYMKEASENENRRIQNLFDTSGLWMSLGITLTTLPVTALAYYEVPIYSPLVNYVVLPLLTPVFCLAVIGGLLGLCLSAHGFVILLLQPCEWLLVFYEWVCELVAKLPGASVICGKAKGWQVVLYYVVLFGGVYVLKYLRRKELGLTEGNKEKKTIGAWKRQLFSRRNIVLAGVLLGCYLCIFFPKSSAFEITFLDVGQGDGIYISAGDGTSYFIDGGSSNVKEVGENRILPFLKSKGVKSIDYWFVSHLDMDHVSGLYEILEKGYKVEHIVLSELCSDDVACNSLCSSARAAGAEILYMGVEDVVRSKEMKITCLGPSEEKGEAIGQDRNENSLVLLVETNECKALFAGDISSDMEERLCKSGVLEDVELFKANHHGSNYSNSTMLFDYITPEFIVVSCALKNLYGHPGTEAVERMEECGAEIFYTMESGQVTFPLIQYPYENN